MKPIRCPMFGTDGQRATYWSVRRVPRAWNCGGTIPRGHGRYISGWEYTSEDGCVRFAEGNWLDLVAAVRHTATNYNLTTTLS